jgi:hypothetical protein
MPPSPPMWSNRETAKTSTENITKLTVTEVVNKKLKLKRIALLKIAIDGLKSVGNLKFSCICH